MSLMQCRSCPAKYVVGLLRCPRCNQVSELYVARCAGEPKEENMPKISATGGASNAGDPEPDEMPVDVPVVADPEPAAEPQEAVVPDGPAVATEAEPVPTPAAAPKARKKVAPPAA